MIGTRMAVVGSVVAALMSILIADSYRKSQYSSLRQKIEEGGQLYTSLNNLSSQVNEDITNRFSGTDVTTQETLNEVINNEMRMISLLVDGIPSNISSYKQEIASIKKQRDDMAKIFETIYKTNISQSADVDFLRKKVVIELTNYNNRIARIANSIEGLQERFVGLLKDNAGSY